MAKAYVTGYSRMKRIEGVGLGQIPDEDSITETQVVDFSGGHAETQSYGAPTVVVRIEVDTICSVAYGASPAAATTDQRWAAGQTEYRGVSPGKKHSFVSNT